MPLCLVCGCFDRDDLCASCRRSLVPGPTRMVAAGLVARAGLAHRGEARRLVHHLKYRGIVAAARVLAVPMAARLPATASVLVPVPRAVTRRLRYGVDPASELARQLGRHTGVPVAPALAPALWWPRHAPRDAAHRAEPRFALRVPSIPEGAVLVDDVVRTGATIRAAARVLETRGLSALAATAPPG